MSMSIAGRLPTPQAYRPTRMVSVVVVVVVVVIIIIMMLSPQLPPTTLHATAAAAVLRIKGNRTDCSVFGLRYHAPRPGPGNGRE